MDTSQSVLLELKDSEYQQSVKDCLTESGVEVATESPGGARGVFAVIRDFPREPGALPIIRMWKPPPRGSNPGSNAFAETGISDWWGKGPDLEGDIVRHMLDTLFPPQWMGIRYLFGAGAKYESSTETRSDDKQACLIGLGSFTSDLKSFVSSGLQLCLDELLSNALYDAPVDDEGRSINAGVERTTHVTSPRPVALTFARDERYVGVGIRDQYGTLDVRRLKQRLAACYSPQGAIHEDKKGGAGLGLFFVMQNANHVVFNITPGRCTEAVVVRKIVQRRKHFMQSAPTLSVRLVPEAGLPL